MTQTGFEPATSRLRIERSTAELLGLPQPRFVGRVFDLSRLFQGRGSSTSD
jgi:hypothetical protein